MDYGVVDANIYIRKSTAKERKDKFPPLVRDGNRVRVPKYVIVTPRDSICTVFGLPQGGDTRAEAIFWAERMASKNGFNLVRPKGWANVEGEI